LGKSKEQLQAQQANLAVQQQSLEQMRRDAAIRERAYGAISPFGNQLLGLGQGSLTGDVPSWLLGPMQEQTGKNFSQARSNLWDTLGSTGQLGSGVGTGPLAYLSAEEANALASNKWQARQTGIGLGLQGANVLSGQQALFNPNQSGATATMDPRQFARDPMLGNILGALIGAGGAAASGGLSRGGRWS